MEKAGVWEFMLPVLLSDMETNSGDKLQLLGPQKQAGSGPDQCSTHYAAGATPAPTEGLMLDPSWPWTLDFPGFCLLCHPLTWEHSSSPRAGHLDWAGAWSLQIKALVFISYDL